MANNFKPWVDTPTAGQQVQSASVFADDAQRVDGFRAGDPASALRVNSALRQANVVVAALMQMCDEAETLPNELSLLSTVTQVKNAIKASVEALHDITLTSAKDYSDTRETAINTNITNVQTQVTGNKNDITTLIGRVDEHDEEIVGLSGDTSTLTTRVDTLETEISDLDDSLSAVAKTGSYADLSGKPSLGSLASKNQISNADVAINAAIQASKIDGLATVATSGNYADLNDKPSLVTESSKVIIGEAASALGESGVAVGYDSEASGYHSTALGKGSNASGYYSAALGKGSNASGPSGTALGNGALVSESEAATMRLGSNSLLSALKCNVQLTVTSDERDKADIATIPNSLDFINKLTPITYKSNQRIAYLSEEQKESENYRKYGLADYDKQEHAQGTKKGERQRVGLKAQEIQQALAEVYGTASYANLVDDNFYDLENKPQDVENQLTVAYSNIIPFLIGAIKELKAEIDLLKGEQI